MSVMDTTFDTGRFWRISAKVAAWSLGALFLFWIFCLNHIGLRQVGVVYDPMNGELTLQSGAGWYVTAPWKQATSLAPVTTQVCTHADSYIVGCKLIRFNPAGTREFVEIEGFAYYNKDGNGLRNRLANYAYRTQAYPFLEILEEIGPVR